MDGEAKAPGVADEAGSERIGKQIGVVFWLIVIIGVASTLYATQRWWLPPLASPRAADIDRMLTIMLVTIGIVFIFVHALLAMFVIRFSRRGGRALYWHENRRLEFLWTVVPAGIMAVMTLMGGSIWASIHSPPPAEAAGEETIEIEVWARQFGWEARYPGPDGQLGHVDPRLVSAENPFGIEPSDPAGADDKTVSTSDPIRVPVNTNVVVHLRSRDVIHSFFVPNLRVKMDAVPGRMNSLWFRPTETGTFEIACAELCGVGHYIMRSQLIVLPQDEFAAWHEAP